MISNSKKNQINASSYVEDLGSELDRTIGVVAAHYDFAVHGGGIGLIRLGKSLPAGSIVKLPNYYGASVAGGATTQLNLTCDSTKISADQPIGDFNIDGAYSSGALSNGEVLLVLPSGGELKMEIKAEALTAGTIRWFVEYYINQDTE